ncbi:MAG: hypothetical protein AB1767_03400 [Bacillota bacterium]
MTSRASPFYFINRQKKPGARQTPYTCGLPVPPPINMTHYCIPAVMITPGTTNVNIFEMEYKHIPRPIYPIGPIDHW